MIRFSKYGVDLVRLEESQIQLVREWRNAAHVREYMDYQDVITPEQQLVWFNSVNNSNNLYFIIESSSNPIGLVHIKDIDWNAGSGEAGVFVGDEKNLNRASLVFAVLAIMDLAFLRFGLQTLKAKINIRNPRTMDFNKHLGYEPEEPVTDSGFQYYYVSEEKYLAAAHDLRKYGTKISGGKEELFVSKDSAFNQKLKRATLPE